MLLLILLHPFLLLLAHLSISSAPASLRTFNAFVRTEGFLLQTLSARITECGQENSRYLTVTLVETKFDHGWLVRVQLSSG